MQIDGAIKLIQKDLDENYYEEGSPLEAATKLGIEALKQVRQIRVYAKRLYLPLLPGETDE